MFLNLILFMMKHHDPKDRGGLPFMLVYATIALGISIGSAIILTLRRAELT